MTEAEYLNSGCENRLSRFIFKNGEEAAGVITKVLFPNEPDRFYLIRTHNMREFQVAMNSNNYKEMKSKSEIVNLAELEDVESMDSISTTIRARIASQSLTPEMRKQVNQFLSEISSDLNQLNHKEITYIQGKPYHILRVGSIRLLVQRKKHSIVVNDIIFPQV